MQISSGIKYRLLPDEQQAQVLSQWIGCQRFIYNAKVIEDRYFRAFSRKSLSLAGILPPVDQRYSQFISNDTAFLCDVPSQILRNGAYRWMTGYQRFFKGLAGRPSTKGKDGRQSVLVTNELFTINVLKDEITLGTNKHPLGTIPYSRHGERLPIPKSICIARHAGKWWVSFNFTQEIKAEDEPLSDGFDLGIAIPVADSNGTHYDIEPVTKERLERMEKNRKTYQRRYNRQPPGSKRRLKTKKQIDQTFEYQANVRNDFAHKTSHKIVDFAAKLFVFEDLKVKNMTKRPKAKCDENGRFIKNGAAAKAGLNRAILNSAWGKVVTYTIYKGLRKNKLTIKVKPNGTSQECSRCGHTHPDNRETQALFVCQSCGLVINADDNAAINIKARGIEKLLSPEFVSRQEKTVRFCRSAVTRDGTPEVKRVSEVALPVAEESPTGIYKPMTARTGDSRKPLPGAPGNAGVCEPRNPHYNDAVPLAAAV